MLVNLISIIYCFYNNCSLSAQHNISINLENIYTNKCTQSTIFGIGLLILKTYIYIYILHKLGLADTN